MARSHVLCALLSIPAAIAAANLADPVAAQTVWSGFSVPFSKGLFADPTSPENQDRITGNVWITRGTNQGLFNARLESGFVEGVSPAGTEWATALLPENAGEAIAASNWADLTFDDWVNAYGGAGTMMLPSRVLANNAVVHLIADDVYLDLRFTNWSGAGGSFAYERAMGTIMPPASTGDYNENGVVDAADYVVWRETLNQTVAMSGDGADGNRSGTVDPGDYDFWRMNFGSVVPPLATGSGQSGAVPEPASAFVLLIGLIGSKCCSRSRVRRPE
jgi:hypothetical protein